MQEAGVNTGSVARSTPTDLREVEEILAGAAPIESTELLSARVARRNSLSALPHHPACENLTPSRS